MGFKSRCPSSSQSVFELEKGKKEGEEREVNLLPSFWAEMGPAQATTVVYSAVSRLLLHLKPNSIQFVVLRVRANGLSSLCKYW